MKQNQYVDKKFNFVTKLLLTFSFSVLFVLFFRSYCHAVVTGRVIDLLNNLPAYVCSGKTWLAIFTFFVLISFYSLYYKKINIFLFEYRYFIAFVCFVLCVLFEVNGSSIGLYCSFFGENDNDIVLGISRVSRHDEWNVFTPMGISQYYNYSGSFPYFSDTVRGCPTDVFLEYGQAAKNPLVIFRPFFWGYLFLPVAKGMAFFWSGRLIALLLVSFEFGLLITKNNKPLSIVMAIMIAYAPVVQWWFAINGLVEMLIYTQFSVLCMQKYMKELSFVKRIVFLALIVICAGGYALTLYPAWMIPCAYVLFTLIAWVFVDNYRNCKMMKRDWVCIFFAVLSFAFSMVYLYYKSSDAIHALRNTVYPGSRFVTGGGMLNRLFLYITNIWHPILNEGAVSNVCESSYFIDFFPICWILPITALAKTDKKDFLLKLLLFVGIFFGVYCVFGFPAIIARITLLSNCQPERVIVLFGFCNVILFVRALSLQQTSRFTLLKSVAISFVVILIALQACKALNPMYLYQHNKILFVTMLIFFCLYAFLLAFSYGRFSVIWKCGCVMLVLAAGFLVNPIRRGIKSVESIAVLQKIKEIHLQDPEGKWITENSCVPINASIMMGAPTINSTNVYPNLERWHIIDPKKEYESIYNRYANFNINLDDVEQPIFELSNRGDSFSCVLSINDLRKLGVSYIITNRDLYGYVYRGDIQYLASVSGYYFYKVNEIPNNKKNKISLPSLPSRAILSEAHNKGVWIGTPDGDVVNGMGISRITINTNKHFITINGWSVDLDNLTNPKKVYLVCGENIAECDVSILRPDVKKALGTDSDLAGFSIMLPIEFFLKKEDRSKLVDSMSFMLVTKDNFLLEPIVYEIKSNF